MTHLMTYYPLPPQVLGAFELLPSAGAAGPVAIRLVDGEAVAEETATVGLSATSPLEEAADDRQVLWVFKGLVGEGGGIRLVDGEAVAEETATVGLSATSPLEEAADDRQVCGGLIGWEDSWGGMPTLSVFV